MSLDRGRWSEHAEPDFEEVDYFQGLVESAPDAMVVVDEAGCIRLVNRQTEVLFGYHRDELIGQTVEVVVPERHREAHPSHRHGYGREPRMRPMGAGLDLMARRKDGSEFPVDISLSPLTTDHGLVVSAVIRDITERKRGEAQLQQANHQLAESVRELERRNEEMTLINELGDMLQSCLTQQEVNDVIERYVARLFRDRSGALFLHNDASHAYEMAASWGDGPIGSVSFDSTACWALRRGQAHVVSDSDDGPCCPHLHDVAAAGLCVPMSAQGATLGLFHLNAAAGEALSDTDRRGATMVADHLSLALANFQLRETLHHQSIRDGLTGLFNRRYLEESLAREIQRALRRDGALSVAIIDLDDFKPLNDRLGHALGDQALIRIAHLLEDQVRGGDIACRYGGDEFVLVLTDCALDAALQRTGELREAINTTTVFHRTGPGPMTAVSIGVASYPQHGSFGPELLAAADAALYQAKTAGGDRVVAATATDLRVPRHA